jgi:hypothetical protein
MAAPLNESFDQAYTEENLMPGVSGSAAREEVSGGQSYADDRAVMAGITFAEPPSSFASYSGDAC